MTINILLEPPPPPPPSLRHFSDAGNSRYLPSTKANMGRNICTLHIEDIVHIFLETLYFGKSFPPCYSQSPLIVVWNLFVMWTLYAITSGLRTLEIACTQKPQRHCTSMNSASGWLFAQKLWSEMFTDWESSSIDEPCPGELLLKRRCGWWEA